MSASTAIIGGTQTTAVHIGIKYVRWGLSLFVFGLVIGYGPWLHYMHGAVEEVQPAFLKNVTLWFGCPWTLPTYVAQLGSLAMVVFGLCYLVTGRDDRRTASGGEQWGPALCALGIRRLHHTFRARRHPWTKRHQARSAERKSRTR